MVFENHQPSSQSTKPKRMISQNLQETEEDAALRAEVAQYRERHTQLLERYEKLNEEMKRKKIDSFEALAEYDKESMEVLIELARLTQSIPLEGNNIGLFGSTSTGNSTLLNSLLGQKVAETGVGETTTQIKAYNGTSFTLWDVPGRNDEVSYFSMEYISFFKGLSRRLILIQVTVKENSSMMKLLDEIGLSYAIVLNKFDKVEQEEQAQVQNQIRSEVKQIGLKGVENIFFVSAKHPKMFPDWIAMTNYLGNILFYFTRTFSIIDWNSLRTLSILSLLKSLRITMYNFETVLQDGHCQVIAERVPMLTDFVFCFRRKIRPVNKNNDPFKIHHKSILNLYHHISILFFDQQPKIVIETDGCGLTMWL
jgi:small GTP-binding protein